VRSTGNFCSFRCTAVQYPERVRAWARGLESALGKWTKSVETRRKARNVTETKISRVLNVLCPTSPRLLAGTFLKLLNSPARFGGKPNCLSIDEYRILFWRAAAGIGGPSTIDLDISILHRPLLGTHTILLFQYYYFYPTYPSISNHPS
jgi:hypothetical protein